MWGCIKIKLDEIDENLWNKNYRKLAAVEELSSSNSLIDLYVKEHQKKYGTKPVWPLGNTHLTLIQDIRRMGGEKTQLLIMHFFKMKAESFPKKNHSLETLKWCLNEVNISLERHGHSCLRSTPIKIQFWRTCSVCEERNEWVGQENEIETNEVCVKCRS